MVQHRHAIIHAFEAGGQAVHGLAFVREQLLCLGCFAFHERAELLLLFLRVVGAEYMHHLKRRSGRG